MRHLSTLQMACLFTFPFTSGITAPLPVAAQEAETEAAEEETVHHAHVSLGAAAAIDGRDGQTAFGGGPALGIQWRAAPFFALELATGIVFTETEPIFVLELAPEIVFDVDGSFEPSIGLGPILAFDDKAGEVELAGGVFVTAGLDWWPTRGPFGAYAKLVYRILGGPGLIQQGVVNIGALFRF